MLQPLFRNFHRGKKNPILLVLSLACALLLYGAARGQAEAPQVAVPTSVIAVKVLTFAHFDSDQAPAFAGRVEAGDSALLAFRVAGQIAQFKVQMGDRVQQGQLLAELDTTDYQLNVDARRAEYQLAQLEAERASVLFTQQLVSEDHHDTAQAQLATKQAQLEQALEQLSFCKLAAPFDGAIAFTYAMPSEVVGPQQPVLNLQDISTLEIQFNLPPRYQPLLQGEDQAQFTVTFELMPGVPLVARYKEVSMQPDPDTNSFPVTLQVDSPANFSARPGMSATIHLLHSSLSGRRWIMPAEALFERHGDSAYVWRIDPSSMTLAKVAIELDAGRAVLSGLQSGDQIVAAGVDRLSAGQRVRPWLREGGL